MTMKLMSWNVNGRTKKETLNDQLVKIKGEDIHILALQEVRPKAAAYFREKLLEIGLKHVEAAPVIQRNRSVLIACRWPLEPVEMIKVAWKESALSAIIKSDYGDIELHTVHVPNASRNGRKTKVDTFDAIYKALAEKSEGHRILCGDFNSPKEEHRDGTIILFGDKDEHRESEERVIRGLGNYDLKDTYRELNGYETEEYSWKNRRFDHIFSSKSLNPIKCGYLHDFRESGLSDHSPVYAVYEPKRRRRPRKRKAD